MGAAALGLLAHGTPARADPQVSVGLTIGAAGEGLDYQFWKRRTAFHLGLHGDVLFGRRSTTDFGVGPYVEIMTHAFDEVQFGGGVSGLMPVIDSFPIVLSAGAYGRKGPEGFGVEPGVAGELFWGARSYNFHSRYAALGRAPHPGSRRLRPLARDVHRGGRAGRPRALRVAGALPHLGGPRPVTGGRTDPCTSGLPLTGARAPVQRCAAAQGW